MLEPVLCLNFYETRGIICSNMKSSKFISLIAVLMLLGGGSLIAQKKHDVIYFGDEKSTIYDIEFIGNTKLAVADGINIKVYNVNNQNLLNELKNGHQDVILSLDVSSDSSKLISAGRNGIICLWDLNKGSLLAKFDYHQGAVTTVKFSPNNKYILSGGIDSQIILYDLKNNAETTRFSGHTDHILCVDFHPTGNIIVSSAADRQVILWNTKNGNQISTINNLKGWQRDIAFSADSTRLFSCGDDALLHIWNINDPKNVQLLTQLKEGSGWLLTQDLNTDGKTIVSGGMGGKIRINYSFGEYIYKVNKPITKVLFVPNEGSHLKVIASTLGGGIIMVDAKNMRSHSK